MNTNFRKLLSFLFIALVLGLVSCKKDDETQPVPTIADNGSSTTAGVGDSITIQALVVAQAKLKTIEVRFDNRTLTSKTNFTNPDSDNFTFRFFVDSTYDGRPNLTFTIVATDRKNQTGTRDFTISLRNRIATGPVADTLATGAPRQLGMPTSFTWERIGSAPGTGLAEFGLAWTSNTASSAIIRKDATKLVRLNTARFDSTTTIASLKAAIDAATDISDIRDVSVTAANQTYSDLVIGTIKNGVYYIIKIERSQVTSTNTGSKVTITGRYRR